MKKITLYLLSIVALVSCNPKTETPKVKSIPVNSSHFIKENLIEDIVTEKYTLSDGTKTDCYKIVVKSVPHEHNMGPWCPKHIDDAKEKGGIWFDKGKVYDVDGHFIANISEFYSDEKWKLYNEDGTIKVTDTEEACRGAARLKVAEKYTNHCVECNPSYFHDHITTYHIPVNPVFLKTGNKFGRDAIGISFNGVNFDPPAPTEIILKAHTLAPLDDCGGHVNPHTGYHYHAATGCTKEIVQKDNHAPMIGYALDGFGIYALLDKSGKEATDLDECRGHQDSIRGYHYHAGDVGGNLIIGCLSGAHGDMKVSH